MKEKEKGKLQGAKDFQQHINLLHTDFHPRERMLNICGRQADPQICLTYKPLKRVDLAGLAWMGPGWSQETDPGQEKGPRTTTGWTLEGPQGKCGKKLSSAPSELGRGPQPQMRKAVPAHTSISALRDPGLDFWLEVRWANTWGLF